MANISGFNTLDNVSITGLDNLELDTLNVNNVTIGATLNLDSNTEIYTNGATISTIELSQLDGVTSNIQSQINSITGTINGIPDLYVSLFDDETVGGDKIFSDTVTVNGDLTCHNDVIFGDTTFTNQLLVNGRESIYNETNPFVTIANYAFDTPVRALNTGASVSAPYTAITGWTFTLISGTAPIYVATGRGFWDSLGPNSYVFYYPGYSAVLQCIAVRQDVASLFQLSQSLTIPTTGIYIVSFWIWGRYNNYSTTQTMASSIGTGSVTGIQATEQYWKKVQYRAYVTAGTQTLSIRFNQSSSVASAICLTNIQMQFVNGLTVGDNDTGIGNSNLITPVGLTTNTIYNEGELWSYGNFTLFGSFAPFLPLVKNSAVIGDCKYGTVGTTSSGEHNYIFSYGCATNIKQGGSSGTLNRVIAIGSGALEQATTATDAIAIGRFANRYSGSDSSICIGNNGGQYFGYVNRTNMSNNIAIGHESIGAVFSTGNQYNISIGNSAMRTGGDFNNPRAYNTVMGHNSGYNIASSNNSILGYNSWINNSATGSSNNTILGANCANVSTSALVNTTFLGAASNLASNFACTNSTAVGANSLISESNTIVMGGLNGSIYPDVVLPTKVKLQSVETIGAVASYTITLPVKDNLVVSTSTTTTIILPTPATSSLGTRFYITRSFTSASPPSITIQATAGINIGYAGVASNTYTFTGLQTMVLVTMVGTTGTAWTISGVGQKITINDITNCFTNATNLTYGTTAVPAGINNTLIGVNSASSISGTTPANNTAIGWNSLAGVSSTGQLNTAVGSNAGAVANTSRNVFIGANAAGTSTVPTKCVFLGYNTAQTNTTGNLDECTFLGHQSNVLSATSPYRNSTAVGAHAVIETDNSIVLGGLNQSDLVTYPNVVLPNKLTLQSATLYNMATLNLTVGRLQSQNYILETNTVITINLPSVAPTNVGLTFTILRGYIPVSGDNFTINTAGGLNIQSARVAPATSYTVDYTITWITLTLVSTTGTINWVANYTRKLATVQDGTTATDIPVCFQSAGDDLALLKIDSPAFTYNPSTETLRVPRLITTNPIYENQESAITVSTTTNLTVDITVGSSSLYRFCNMGTATVTYRLPTITSTTIGWGFRIKRMYGSNYNACTINPSAFTTQAIILEGTGVPTVSTTAVTISATQSMAQFVSTIVQLGGFTGTFTNTLGSSTININSITAGNIVMVGGILNLNGNIRTITAYGTGRGQTGTYTVSASITVANTNQSFTSTESYGYIRTDIN